MLHVVTHRTCVFIKYIGYIMKWVNVKIVFHFGILTHIGTQTHAHRIGRLNE